MWFHISVAALLLQAASPSQSSQSSQPRLAGYTGSTNAATDAAGFAVIRFLSSWRTAWLESGDLLGAPRSEVRLRDVHCHWDGSYGNSGTRGNFHPPSLIHRSSRRSMCPDWLPADERLTTDERLVRDASLSLTWRDRIRTARAMLLDSLAYFDRLHPGDSWITGERVRFLVDQRETAAAIALARSCAADKVWCAQLTGYALDAANDFAAAYSAFD